MRLFGLLGKKLGHSFSQDFFTDYFNQHGIEARYTNFEISTITDIQPVLKKSLAGLNVTIPYKETVIDFLDELTPEAREIGAVNCIEFKQNKLVGHNTDAFGFHQAIKPFLTNKHERAVILGTGGSSKAVAYVLKKIGIDCIFISRNPIGENQFAYSEINQLMLNTCKLIVNCTPVGMYPNSDNCINIPYHFLTSEHLVVDLIYNPIKTKFLLKSELSGAQILNGETMLKQQALKSWEIWNQGS